MWKQYGGFPKLNRPDVTFIHGTATGINCGSQTLLYNDTHNKPQSQQYDYILVSTGVRRKWPIVPRADSFLPYVKDASSYSQQILAAEKLGVVVIGGGKERPLYYVHFEILVLIDPFGRCCGC